MTTTNEARAIAKEAYIYGFPMVDSYRIQIRLLRGPRESRIQGALEPDPQHPACLHAGRQGGADPNSDTPYSMLGMDLRAEPIVLTVPTDREGALFQHPAR